MPSTAGSQSTDPGQQQSPPGSQADSGSESAGDSGQTDAGASEDAPPGGSEGQMADGEDGLDGMSVEDAASDVVLQDALEALESIGAGASEGDTDAQPSDDIALEETESSGEGAEAGSGSSGEGMSSETGQSGAMSQTEELAELNSQLDQALERFDGEILSERDSMAQQENKEAGESGMGGMGGTGESAEDSSEAASGAPVLAASGGGASPAIPASPRPGNYRPTNTTEPVPDDVPDGADDDIVARQIREAAMAETDPELREKLWEEYRKYKQR